MLKALHSTDVFDKILYDRQRIEVNVAADNERRFLFKR